MRGLSRRGWITAGVVLVLLIVLAIVAWPRGRQLPRAREYRNVDACLLTGPAGITETQAAAVWAGMQDASAATLARVSYLAVVGPAPRTPRQTGGSADGRDHTAPTLSSDLPEVREAGESITDRYRGLMSS